VRSRFPVDREENQLRESTSAEHCKGDCLDGEQQVSSYAKKSSYSWYVVLEDRMAQVLLTEYFFSAGEKEIRVTHSLRKKHFKGWGPYSRSYCS